MSFSLSLLHVLCMYSFLLLIIPDSNELECFECSYSQTPSHTSAEEYEANNKCLDPIKHSLQPLVCKGDNKCVKGSYIHSLNGKEMYRRCEPHFETGCKPLPNTNGSHLPTNGHSESHPSKSPSESPTKNPIPVYFTKEYICVCNQELCNSEPGPDVQRQNFTDFVEYKRYRGGAVRNEIQFVLNLHPSIWVSLIFINYLTSL